MNPTPPVPEAAPGGDAVLVPWLAALSAIAAVAALQALLFPSGPRVEELPQASLLRALREARLEAKPLPPRPAEQRADAVLSRQLGWSLAGDRQLWMVHGAVRRYQDLQAAALTRAQPSLRLQGRRLDQPIAGSASGRIAGRPAVQTCLVLQNRGLPLSGVTRSALLRASDPRRNLADLRDPQSWSSSLVNLLLPRRFSCVLITLRSENSAGVPPQQWTQLLKVLQTALQAPRTH